MIVLTGFGPFGPPGSVAHETNPSEALAREAGSRLGAHVEILPVSYAAVSNIGRLYADAELILSIGVAGGRTVPLLERQAVNWKESGTADIDGFIARGERIDPDGPDVVQTGWDVEHIGRSVGIRTSASAGTYVCNALSYSLYRHHRNACFVHIPPAEHLSLDEGANLIEGIIECSMSA